VSVVVLALAGCAGGDDDAEPPPSSARMLRVYFVRGENVGPAARAVPQTQAVGASAVRELLAGPSAEERAAGLVSSVPGATRLNDLSIDDGVATVDLTRAFESGGGSTSMKLRVAQVVYTLTQFPTVKRVRFRLDGRPVDAIGGEGVVVDPPVGRAAFEDETPAILVESPTPGAIVTSPLRVRGTANTFEATLNLRLLDSRGKVLYDDFTTATSGTGRRGTFRQTARFELSEDGPGTLVAYERSAADGSEINVVRIPVELRR
jgi:germination protein M